MAIREELWGLAEPDFQRFCSAFAGRRKYIPSQKVDRDLQALLSPDGFRWLMANLGGCSLDVPMGRTRRYSKVEKPKRDRMIRERRRQGATIRVLIQQFQISRAQVFRICDGIKI